MLTAEPPAIAPPAASDQPWVVDPVPHHGLVWQVALGFSIVAQTMKVDVEDLASEGQIGLLHACRNFDPGRGLAFCTYATHCIRGSITRAIKSSWTPVRVPSYLYNDLNMLEQGKVRRDDLSPSRRRLVDRARSVLQAELKGGDALAPIAARDTRPGPDEATVDRVRAEVARLPQRERVVVERYYGFRGRPQTVREIACDLRSSAERVQQRLHSGLRILRRQLRDSLGDVD